MRQSEKEYFSNVSAIQKDYPKRYLGTKVVILDDEPLKRKKN